MGFFGLDGSMLFGGPIDQVIMQLNPTASAALIGAQAAALSAGLLLTQNNDSISAGTAAASQYLQDIAVYISDQAALLNALESYASAGGGGIAPWVSSEIAYLQGSVASEVPAFYNYGGTISNIPTASTALTNLVGSSNIPPSGSNTPTPASPLNFWTTASAAVASALAGPAGLSAMATLSNSGVDIGGNQIGGGNYASGNDINQGGIGNYGAGNKINEAGFGHIGIGNLLDAMGIYDTLEGDNLLAIGSFIQETGSFDVANGNNDTISGSYDSVLGNNDSIIGDGATVYGYGLSLTVSSGETVFGTGSNYTIVNANGTWSTVINGTVASSGANASTDCMAGGGTVMAAESAAMGSAEATAHTNYLTLSSQLVANGWSQVVSDIGGDMAASDFGWNFGGSATSWNPIPATSSLSAADLTALVDLAGYGAWGPTTSAEIESTLSQILGRDGPDSVLGADAQAALQLISAGADPTQALGRLQYEAAQPNMTSTTSLAGANTGSVTTQDWENINIANQEYNAGDYAALSATLAVLATSSNPEVASIASAELIIAAKDGPSATGSGITIALWVDYLSGSAIPTSLVSTISAELASAGVTATWTGSTFTNL